MGFVTLQDEKEEHQLAVTEQRYCTDAIPKPSCRRIAKWIRMNLLKALSCTVWYGPERTESCFVGDILGASKRSDIAALPRLRQPAAPTTTPTRRQAKGPVKFIELGQVGRKSSY